MTHGMLAVWASKTRASDLLLKAQSLCVACECTASLPRNQFILPGNMLHALYNRFREALVLSTIVKPVVLGK